MANKHLDEIVIHFKKSDEKILSVVANTDGFDIYCSGIPSGELIAVSERSDYEDAYTKTHNIEGEEKDIYGTDLRKIENILRFDNSESIGSRYNQNHGFRRYNRPSHYGRHHRHGYYQSPLAWTLGGLLSNFY